MKKPLIFASAAIVGITIGLYFALASRETPALPERDFTAVAALQTNDMARLQLRVNRGSDVAFQHEDGSDTTLAAYAGDYVVLNFWATWCAPCRKEMPHLSQLARDLEGQNVQVVTIATGLNQRPAMERFLEDIGVDNLPLHTDASSALARDFGISGLPVTLILDRQGYEVARLIGDADWASDDAKAVIAALMAD